MIPFFLASRTISRILFKDKPDQDQCLVEWRQMNHAGDNQDVWAIDDIRIRDVPTAKAMKKQLHVK